MLTRVLHTVLLIATDDDHIRRSAIPSMIVGDNLLTPSTPLLPDGITLRLAEAHELEQVAALQMDIFAPEDDPPAMPALIQGLFEANQRAARAGMRKRLTDELITRVDKGSDIIIAVAEGEGDASMHAGDTANGLYTEPGPPLLGAVDVSCQEMMLPTHAIAGGLYLSHMAVAESARRRGIARALLQAASDSASRRGEDALWLHVEPHNQAAISLYEKGGYKRQPEGLAPFSGFTAALDLQHRAILYRLALDDDE